MSDTPISDSTAHNVADLGMLCRRLERQLNAANDRINGLENAIRKTLDKNRHLADGDDCTLIDLKKALPEWK